MKNSLNLKRRRVFAVLGIAFCILFVWGCGRSEKPDTTAETFSENGDSAGTEQIDKYDLELDYNAYEKDYSTELQIGSEITPLEIWSSNVGYQVIKIGSQEIPYEQREQPLGGAGLTTMAYDFTGDEKEEIIFVEASGASGAFQYILVFSDTDGQWERLELPSDLYSDEDLETLKKQLKELDVKTDDSVHTLYRTVTFHEEKMIVKYGVYADSDSQSKKLGEMQRELYYVSDGNKFVTGDILFIPDGN